MTRKDKISAVVIAVVLVVLLLLLRKHNTTIVQSGNTGVDIPAVQPLNANLHTFNIPAAQFLLSLPELHLFALKPGCKCQSDLVH